MKTFQFNIKCMKEMAQFASELEKQGITYNVKITEDTDGDPVWNITLTGGF